jgi:hypothetical protein
MANHFIVTLSSTTPTRLSPQATHSGVEVILQNISTNGYVYVGGPDVSSTNYGFRVDEDSAFGGNVPSKEEMWAIAETNGTVIAVYTSGLVM